MNEIKIHISSDIPSIKRGIEIYNGKSAYQVAVENGFTGTEEEWIDSLKVKVDTFNSALEFPNVGKSNVLYIAKDTWSLYVYDIDLHVYRPVGDSATITNINGGSINA